MTKPTLNIDRKLGFISITRKFPNQNGLPPQVESAHFTVESALEYIAILTKGIQKINETPVPSGPKGA